MTALVAPYESDHRPLLRPHRERLAGMDSISHSEGVLGVAVAGGCIHTLRLSSDGIL